MRMRKADRAQSFPLEPFSSRRCRSKELIDILSQTLELLVQGLLGARDMLRGGSVRSSRSGQGLDAPDDSTGLVGGLVDVHGDLRRDRSLLFDSRRNRCSDGAQLLHDPAATIDIGHTLLGSLLNRTDT